MISLRVARASLVFSSFLLLLAGLSLGAQSPDPREVAQAEKFIRALNANDVDILMAVSADPFLFRDQKWEMAKDGIGFVLAAVKDDVLSGKKARRAFFRTLIAKVKVEDTKGNSPFSIDSFLQKHLKGAPERWSQLTLYVFTRGFGDVEHIALVGIDPKGLTVVGLYVN